MVRWDELDRYVIITSDAHGGAAMADYKPYLERRWHDEFDDWLAGVVMPWVDVNDTSNWDSELRLANMDADGCRAEIVFPNTLPPFFDILRAPERRAADRDIVRAQVGGLPCAQPLARRLLQPGAGAAPRHLPAPAQRHRRGGRRDAVGRGNRPWPPE